MFFPGPSTRIECFFRSAVLSVERVFRNHFHTLSVFKQGNIHTCIYTNSHINICISFYIYLYILKEENEKVGLKLNIQKTKIRASGPITSWQINGETMETVTDCIYLGSKITADGDCSHEIKRHLLLGRKPMTNLDSILKSRDITLPTKVCLVKAMVFLTVMYGCESWTVEKAECRRVDAFELWCWRRLLRVPLDYKEIQPVHPKGNQS